MRDFKELEIWQISYKFALDIYKITKDFPKEEMFGLISQLRRSSYSMSTNIAEGCGKTSKVEFLRFLQMTAGSLSETNNHLMFARDLGYINEAEYKELSITLHRIQKMLISYMSKVKGTLKNSKS